MKVEDLASLFWFSEEIGYAVTDAIFDTKILEDLKTFLLVDEECPYCVLPHIENRIEMLTKNKTKDLQHNDPIDVLLAQLKDKESKWSATRQLKNRFLGLDYDIQIKVMEMFLNMSGSYRKWCYATLRQWREPLFDDRIIELWKEFKESGCSRLIASTLPAEKIEPILSDFEHQIKRRDYFMLIRRFGKESWFHLNNELLENLCFTSSPINSNEPYLTIERCRNHYFYLWGMSLTNEVVPVNICWEIISMFLLHALRKDALEKLVNNASLFEIEYGGNIPFYDLLSVSNGDRITFKDYLQCLVRMGHFDLVTKTVSWMFSVNKQLPLQEVPDTSNENYYRYRLMVYYTLAAESLPLNSEDLERINICTKNEAIPEIASKWAEQKKRLEMKNYKFL